MASAQRRQTRIKSLYATTAQDLTLDLNKINEDLQNGRDSGGRDTKKSGSFNQSRPNDMGAGKSSTKQQSSFNENWTVK